MYEINGICYAGEKTADIKIVSAKVLIGGMMLIEFNSGEKRIWDPQEETGSVFLPLREIEVLEKFEIFHGVLTWQNGTIDIAPETLYDHSYEYNSCGIA